jgi:hypothetical protein
MFAAGGVETKRASTSCFESEWRPSKGERNSEERSGMCIGIVDNGGRTPKESGDQGATAKIKREISPYCILLFGL